VLEANAVTKASQSLGQRLAAIRRASADASAAAAFDSFHRRLPTSIQINQLFRQRQVCLKGLHCDQRRRLTVPDENGECLVPGFGQVVGPVAIR